MKNLYFYLLITATFIIQSAKGSTSFLNNNKLVFKSNSYTTLFNSKLNHKTTIVQSNRSNSSNKNRKDPIVEGRFNTDSISLGQLINYIITIEYPRTMEAVLPDSTYDFSPYEYVKMLVYPTVSSSTTSRDSIVYVLTTFAVDSIQKLAIPVNFIPEDDEYISVDDYIKKQTDTVSLFFKSHLLSMLPLIVDIPATEGDIQYIVIRDYQGWSIVFLILGAILFALGLYFRHPIYVYLTEKRLKRSHNGFVSRIHDMIDSYENSPQEAERLIGYWKKYMERLEKKPFTKYTQKDFNKLKLTKKIVAPMQKFERFIYGNVPIDAQIEFKKLLSFSNECFEDRIVRLKISKRKEK